MAIYRIGFNLSAPIELERRGESQHHPKEVVGQGPTTGNLSHDSISRVIQRRRVGGAAVDTRRVPSVRPHRR
jgi:hypothetical protein